MVNNVIKQYGVVVGIEMLKAAARKENPSFGAIRGSGAPGGKSKGKGSYKGSWQKGEGSYKGSWQKGGWNNGEYQKGGPKGWSKGN